MSEPDVPAGNGEAIPDAPDTNDVGPADPEAPDADAAEQRTPVAEDELYAKAQNPADTRVEVNEADAADQYRAVELDEDDYR